MATLEEKQKFYEALAFTPRTYTVSMWGYGGEIVMGTVDRKIFDYFKKRRLSVVDYAVEYEYAEDNNIPDEMCPFESGSWYECDNMAHASGASLDCGTLQITDENNEIVVEQSLEEIDGTDIQLTGVDESWITDKPEGTVVFVGRSGEKGTFFSGELELTAPFDPNKLSLSYDEVDGEDYVSGVYYNDIEIPNNDYSTNGKSSDFGFYLVGPNNTWEEYKDYDSIKYPVTDWFPKKTKPERVGVYEIKTAGRNSYEYQAKWTGSRWISHWNEDVPETEELKIKEWRGISCDPDSIDFVEEDVKIKVDAS